MWVINAKTDLMPLFFKYNILFEIKIESTFVVVLVIFLVASGQCSVICEFSTRVQEKNVEITNVFDGSNC